MKVKVREIRSLEVMAIKDSWKGEYWAVLQITSKQYIDESEFIAT